MACFARPVIDPPGSPGASYLQKRAFGPRRQDRAHFYSWGVNNRASLRAGAGNARFCRGAPPPAPSEQVDPHRDGDRERDAGVPVIALQDEDDGGEEARQRGAEPGQASQFHGRILVLRPDAVVVRNGV